MTPREGVPVGPPPCGWSATKPTKVGRYLRQRDGVVSIVNLREARELWGGEDKTLTVLYEYCGRWSSGEWPCAEGLWAPVPTHDAAHPAATAREEAWKAMVAYIECEDAYKNASKSNDWMAPLTAAGWDGKSNPRPLINRLRTRALALARSTGAES